MYYNIVNSHDSEYIVKYNLKQPYTAPVYRSNIFNTSFNII